MPADLKALKQLAVKVEKNVRNFVDAYVLPGGKRIYLIGEGRLVNLAAAEGHPASVMDMSFANQFLAVLKLAQQGQTMKPLVYNIDRAQDQEIAHAKLQAMGVELDTLTPAQKAYLEGFSEGT